MWNWNDPCKREWMVNELRVVLMEQIASTESLRLSEPMERRKQCLCEVRLSTKLSDLWKWPNPPDRRAPRSFACEITYSQKKSWFTTFATFCGGGGGSFFINKKKKTDLHISKANRLMMTWKQPAASRAERLQNKKVWWMPPPPENPGPFSIQQTLPRPHVSVTGSEGLPTQLTDIETVINGALGWMLKERLTPAQEWSRDLPESSHIKKTLEHPDANTGRFVGFFGRNRHVLIWHFCKLQMAPTQSIQAEFGPGLPRGFL